MKTVTFNSRDSERKKEEEEEQKMPIDQCGIPIINRNEKCEVKELIRLAHRLREGDRMNE